VAVLFAAAAPAAAADLYWSDTGTWDTTTANWGLATGGPYTGSIWSNATPDAAFFEGTAGTVTLGEAITAAGLTFTTTGYTVTGNTLTLAGTPSISTGAGISATIASVLAGTSGFAKTGAGTLTLSAANTISGAATVSAGRIVLGSNTALGTTAVTLDGGSIERNVAGATVANAIAVGAGGGTIVGRTTVDNYATFSGQLTGSGTLTVQGLVTLSNSTNTYSGALTISNASATFLRLATSEVLGDAAVVTLGGAGAELRLDGGVTETIAGLNGSAGNIFVADGSGSIGTLNVGSGSFAGTLTNGNRSLIFEKSGAGTLELSRSGGNGQAITGLEVIAGTLRLNAGGVGFKAGYFTGSQPITVRAGATLAVNQAWNIGASNVVVVDGGTLSFTTNTDGPNYANVLTLQNGGRVTGDWRLGDQATASLTTTGDTTNTIAGTFRLTKQASGDTAWTVNVADGAAATDLDITAVISDLAGRAGAAVVKTGAGTMRLAAANSYTGATTIAMGDATLANGTALGSSNVTLTSAATGTSAVSLLLESEGTVANAITAANNGTSTVTIGSTNSTTGANRQFSGVVTLARDLTLQAGSTDRTTFSNQITGTGNVTITSPFASGRRVVFDRSGGSANNFVGDLTLGAGAWLQLGVANSIGNRTLPDTATVSFTDSNSQLRPAPTGSGDSETVGTLVSSAAGAGRVDMFTGTAFTLKIGGDDESGTFSGTIVNSSGALSLEKVGSGTQTLSGANTYGGSTIVTAGTLVVGNGAGGGSIGGGAVTVASGATFTINRGGFGQVWANNFSGAGALQILAGQDPQFSGDNSNFTGPVTIDGASAQFRTRSANAWSGQSVVTITNGGMASVFSYVNDAPIKAGSLWGNGTVRLGASGNSGLTVGGNNLDATFSGTIVNDAGGSGAVTKIGTGTQTLSGNNSYSGGTVVSAGALIAANNNAFGTTGTVTLGNANSGANNAAVLISTTSGNVTISRPMTVANQGSGTFTLGSTGGTNFATFSGAVTLAKGVTLTGGSGVGRTDFSGGISGTGDVRITGSSRVVFLTTANTYTGTTTIEAGGTLQLSDGGAVTTSFIPDTSVVFAEGTLNFAKGNNSETIGGLSGSGVVQVFPGLAQAATLIVDTSQTHTFSGTIGNGTAGTMAVTKTGTGTQTFAAASTYTGSTTINGGTLLAGNANAFGTSGTISVGASGTLGVGDGVAFTRPFAVAAGGRVRTGNGSAVSLPSVAALAAWESQSATGNQTLAEILNATGSTTPTALASAWTANPGTYFSDILTLDGTGAGNTYVLSMAYTGASDNLNIWYRANVSDSFVPLGTSFAGNVPWTSSFTTPGQYGVDTSAGTVWAVTDHNSQFVVVPEPGTLGLAAVWMACGFWYLRGQWVARRP
jgi:autotransporter-associated beta strand protein